MEKLRDRYDVTIAAAQEGSNERRIYTLRSIDHEAEAAIDAYEAEFGADGTRVFRDPAAEQPPQPTVAQLIKDDKFYTEAEHDDFDDIDPIAIREALSERGIVNGKAVDPEKLNSDPFIQQVMRTVNTPAADVKPSYKVGDTIYLDNKPFEITEIGLFDVHLRDPSQVYPIFRAESKERLTALLRRDERNAHLFAPKRRRRSSRSSSPHPLRSIPLRK